MTMHSMDAVYNQVKITEVAGSTQSKKDHFTFNWLACGVNRWVHSHLTTKISWMHG